MRVILTGNQDFNLSISFHYGDPVSHLRDTAGAMAPCFARDLEGADLSALAKLAKLGNRWGDVFPAGCPPKTIEFLVQASILPPCGRSVISPLA